MERIIEGILDIGCIIFGEYVRDVIIRGEKTFKDIDIICEIERYNDLRKVLERGHLKYKNFKSSYEDLKELLGRLSYVFVTIILDGIIYDIRIVEKVETHCKDFTCNIFYLAKDRASVHYLPEGETLPSPLGMIYRKETKIIPYTGSDKSVIFTSRLKRYELNKRGWTIIS